MTQAQRIALALILAMAPGPLLLASTEVGDGGELLEPILRYVVVDGEDSVAEFVGPENSRWLTVFPQYPRAETAAMQVDCTKARETGSLFKPTAGGGWIYGAKPKYRFYWTHSELGKTRKDMYYKFNSAYRLIRGVIPIDDWNVNGMVDLEVRVSGETVYATQSELSNCES